MENILILITEIFIIEKHSHACVARLSGLFQPDLSAGVRLGVLRPVIWKQDKIRLYVIVWAGPRQEENAVLIQGNRFLMVKTSGTLLAESEKLCRRLLFCPFVMQTFRIFYHFHVVWNK